MNKLYLVITPFFPTPSSFRGPYVLDQVKALQRLSDFKVVVLKPKPWYVKSEDYAYESVKVYRFSSFELPSNILPGLFNALSVWSLKRKLKKIGINPKEIAVAHAHVTGLGFYANALKKENPKLKSLLQHHGLDVLSLENGILRDKKWHRSWVRHYGLNICKAIDLHIGVSQKTLDQFKVFPKLQLKQTCVLYNGVDITKFYSLPDIKKSKDFVIGCVANFWSLKDQMTLLKAVKLLSDKDQNNIRVKFVGTGETLDDCMAFVAGNNILNRVEFIPEIPHDKLIYYYNTIDLFILPSYYEAFGCVYTEAYACGVPFMAVKNQGIAELIPETEQDKWLIEKGDYKALAEKIESFKNKRYVQKLNGAYEINDLIKQFLDKIVESDA